MRWIGLCALLACVSFVGSPVRGQEPAVDAGAASTLSPEARAALLRRAEASNAEMKEAMKAYDGASNALPAAAKDAFEAWAEALGRKPALVSLGSLEVQAQMDEALEKSLRGRLALLGRKKVSNRQWQDYWAKQATLSEALAAKLTGSSGQARAKALRGWAALAKDKVANQDTYLQAIEDERDAVEERLEAGLADGAAGESVDSVPKASLTTEASPFEARQRHIAELTYRIRQQEVKQATTESAKKHTERQTGTQGIMAKALSTDLSLAKRERDITRAQEESVPGEWSRAWDGVRVAAEDKVRRLSDEVALGEQRVRALEVELSLLASQIAYRTRKKGELTAELETASSTSGWFVAVGDTGLNWLRTEGWQVALLLLFLWLAVKVALRLIDTFTNTILKAVEDDDPDSTSQEEARAKTIGSVFRSVARVAVTVVGVLMALEMLGVNTAPILGSVAILGLAISFGSQSLVKDIVTGFFILLENQFAVGDVITVSGKTGTVEDISLRTTRVRQSDGTLHVVPNGQISTVANLTRDWSRTTVHVGVGYDADLRAVERIVNEVGDTLFAEEDWAERLEEAPYFVGVTELGDSAVKVRVTAKVDPGAQWGLERELNRRLLDALSAASIDIPFPQQVVWHQNTA